MRIMRAMTYTKTEIGQKHFTKEIGKNTRYKWVSADQVNQLAST